MTHNDRRLFAIRIQLDKGVEMTFDASDEKLATAQERERHHVFRFHLGSRHLNSVFGDDWFGRKAETFARFFGTSTFLIGQTVVVGLWIAVNMTGLTKFDVYPFILLNLMFSLQAAYAAPLILLAQTRQADRDKALSEADAQHREALAVAAEQREIIAAQQTQQLMTLMKQNTELTELVKSMSERIQAMTAELHQKMVQAT
jgi:uncharacterized membrane protein